MNESFNVKVICYDGTTYFRTASLNEIEKNKLDGYVTIDENGTVIFDFRY